VNARLMTPGPVALLDEARQAMAAPIIHHRTEEFRALVRECREGLREFFRTGDDVAILTGSGTGGMEAAVVNLLSPGDRVLVGTCGKFGDRWAEIASAYGIEAEVVRTATGDGLDADEIARRLAALRPAAFFLTASETSVGVKNDLEMLAAAARRASPDTLIVVDAITALGAFRFETRAWGIDAAVCASQKALSLPPGLAFVSMSPRAREAAAKAKLPRFYFDILHEIDKQSSGDTAFTPAITLVVGLAAALAVFRRKTMETVWRETARRAEGTRAAFAALGLDLVPKRAYSESVTAAWSPAGTDGARLVRDLAVVHGIKIAGGQGDLAGRILRVAHFGPLTDEDTLDCVSGIEDLLLRAGRSIDRGAARAAARRAMSARP
jgi:aspartate aminotransferase-like enzyme